MKQGRHFTASVFIVHNNKVLLHQHQKFDLLLPVGGYLEGDELPHEAAIREAHEEAGLEIIILHHSLDGDERLQEIPHGAHLNLIQAKSGVEQIDFTFYAVSNTDIVTPESGKKFHWYTLEELEQIGIDSKILRYACEAITLASENR